MNLVCFSETIRPAAAFRQTAFEKSLFFPLKISIILFVFVFLAIWVEEWDKIISFITRAGLVALILNIVMIFIGYYTAKYFTSGVEQRKCISLECGLQNGTLAVFVATQLFDDIVFMVPTAAYALIMFVTSIFFVLIVRKIN